MVRIALAIVTISLMGCDQPPGAEFDLVTSRELELQVDALDARVDALSDKAAQAGGAPAPANAEREAEAYAVYQELQKAMMQDQDVDKAVELLTKLQTFTDVPPAMQAAGQLAMQIDIMRQQKDMIGKEAPPLQTDKWFVGQSGLDDGKATLLVFWEVWCPHCKREVPKLQATYDKYKGQGLNVVGVTQVNQGKTDEDVMNFINEQSISYPIAKAPQSVPDSYLVQGVPSAAVVKDGKVLWLGHPATLNDEMIEGWL